MKTAIQSADAEATEQLAATIGSRLKGGEVIELIADLGGGKTTFMRGLARGAGSQDVVASPTFTVSRLYIAPAFEIHHFDFYRLQDPGLIMHELEDLVGDPNAVVAVEWAQDVQQVLPPGRLTIRFVPKSDDERIIEIDASSTFDYLLTGLS